MNNHQVNQSGNCVIEGCPCRGWSAQEGATVTQGCPHPERHQTATYIPCQDCSYRDNPQLLNQHEPAARGGGDDSEWRLSTEAMNAFVSRKLGDDGMPVFAIDVPDKEDRIHYAKIVVCGDQKLAQQIIDQRERVKQLESAIEVAIHNLNAGSDPKFLAEYLRLALDQKRGAR